MGSTLPSPSVPSPVPSFQPIIFKSLFPTLFVSCPGLIGGGGGEGGGGGPSACLLFPEFKFPAPDPAFEGLLFK